MKNKISTKILVTTIATLSINPIAFSNENHNEEDFKEWLSEFKEEVISNKDKYKISEENINIAFNNTNFLKRAIKSDKNQSEFRPSFEQYLGGYLSPAFTKKALKLRRKHWKSFDKVDQKYHIPRNYLIALWGAETSFGKFFGNQHILSSTATLAYEGRREEFFKKQFIAAIKIAEENDFNLAEMEGSWAGGLGNFQFIPTTFEQYAVDGNNNGKIDLWNDMDDAFSSAANLLTKYGWKEGELWGREIILPENFDEELLDINGEKEKQTVSFWKSKGIKTINNKELPNSKKLGRVIKTNDGARTFLVYNNFEVIRRWNRSNHYALKIGLIRNELANEENLKLLK